MVSLRRCRKTDAKALKNGGGMVRGEGEVKDSCPENRAFRFFVVKTLSATFVVAAWKHSACLGRLM